MTRRSAGLGFHAATDNFLPRSIFQRVALVLLALPLGALSVGMLFSLLPELAQAPGWKTWAILFVVIEFFGALAVVSGLATVWAFFQPPWIEQPARKFANKLVWWFFVVQVLPFFLVIV